MKQFLAILMLLGVLGAAQAQQKEPPFRNQLDVADRIIRAGAIAARRGEKTANAEASVAAQQAREAPTLEAAVQIYKNFNKRNN
jgi:hypothetical protein